MTRAVRYSTSDDSLRRELSYIHRKFTAYSYPANLIRTVTKSTMDRMALKARALPAPEDTSARPPLRVSIPFTGESLYLLRHLARKIGVTLVSKPMTTIGGSLCSGHKHHLPKNQESGVVYGCRCSCGGYYVGETGRELGERISEHVTGWRKGAASSAFGGHNACQPKFDF